MASSRITVDELFGIDQADWLMARAAMTGDPPIMTPSFCTAVDSRQPMNWTETMAGRFSEGFVLKEEMIRERWAMALSSRSADDYSNFLMLVGSLARFPTMLLAFRAITPSVWWEVFAQEWTGTDGARRQTPELRRLLRSATPEHLALLMTTDARAELAKMPERMTVWRGCYEVNRRGLSWSLDRDVAARFPLLNRYWRPEDQPILLRGTVRREHVALFLDRDEQEVLSAKVFGITTTPLEARPIGTN